MQRNFYTLQLCIYSVALHRYLRLRKPGYDFDQHFGGAFYIFLRGIDPGRAGERRAFRAAEPRLCRETQRDFRAMNGETDFQRARPAVRRFPATPRRRHRRRSAPRRDVREPGAGRGSHLRAAGRDRHDGRRAERGEASQEIARQQTWSARPATSRRSCSTSTTGSICAATGNMNSSSRRRSSAGHVTTSVRTWQKRDRPAEVAATRAVTNNFTVITGGPGTGKTRTVTDILTLLHEQPAGDNLRIALAAPTGKAAARLTESVRAVSQTFAATTIHRLLGYLPGSPYFRHDAEHPLSADVVIIDEASMVDLALMAKLVAAVPPEARLILLGDRDQLASVEAGSVLADICAAAETATPNEPLLRLGGGIAAQLPLLRKRAAFTRSAPRSMLATRPRRWPPCSNAPAAKYAWQPLPDKSGATRCPARP